MPLRVLVLVLLAVAALVVWTGCAGSGEDEPTPVPFDLNAGSPEDGGLRQDVHWHADFVLVINGEQYDFNQEPYVTTEETEIDPYLHIHPNRFTVAHVHREQSTWDEFFKALDWELGDDFIEFDDGQRTQNAGASTWKFFVNGVQVDSVQDHYIGEMERTLIVYGPESPKEALELYWPDVSDEACIVSGTCSDRIDPNEPPEPCSGRGHCTG